MAKKFWQHPLNYEISDFLLFLWNKRREHIISPEEFSDVCQTGMKVLDDAGLPPGPDLDDLSLRVFRQHLHVMKDRLLALHPEFADDIRNLSSGRDR